MSLEYELLKKSISKIDLSRYEKQIQEAVDSYFKNGGFSDEISEALNESEIGWKIADAVADAVEKAVDQFHFEITVSPK